MGRTSDARERIIEAAAELFYKRSYADVGVQAVCAHAGVKKGSFYHFFASKQALTIAVLEYQAEQVGRRVIGPAFSSERPPVLRVVNILERMAEFQSALQQRFGFVLGCPFGNLAMELSTQDEAIRQVADRVMGRFCTAVREQLQAAVASGDLAPDTPLDALADQAVAYIEGALLMGKVRNDPQLIGAMAAGLQRLLMGDGGTASR